VANHVVETQSISGTHVNGEKPKTAPQRPKKHKLRFETCQEGNNLSPIMSRPLASAAPPGARPSTMKGYSLPSKSPRPVPPLI